MLDKLFYKESKHEPIIVKIYEIKKQDLLDSLDIKGKADFIAYDVSKGVLTIKVKGQEEK